VVIAGVLASYTSFNGALLALSRLVAAMATQGVLPRALGRIHPRRLVPRRALALLFVLAVAATLAFSSRRAAEAVISLAAATAALVYAASVLARERAPFAEPGRGPWRRRAAVAGAVLLGAFGAGAVADAMNPVMSSPSSSQSRATFAAFSQGVNRAH
jgi:amino acid transporter